MPTKTRPSKTRKYRKKLGLFRRISQHPTIRMIGLFSNLPISNSKSEGNSSLTKKVLLSTIFIALGGLLTSIYISGSNKQETENTATSIQPVEKTQKNNDRHITVQTPVIKVSSLPNQTETNDTENSIKPVAIQTNNVVQSNSQKIDKLEMLLLEEQRKNNELYQKLSTQDTQLKELLASAIKNIIVNDTDKAYINSITQKENTTTSDKTKLEKVDYYNKVRVLLKGQQQNQISTNDHRQLQVIVNQLLNRDNTKENSEEESTYSKSLNKESVVRINEVRSIILKKGETLWGLAKRAYGDGKLYQKIMKANPQINEENARYLQPGTLIRIPT